MLKAKRQQYKPKRPSPLGQRVIKPSSSPHASRYQNPTHPECQSHGEVIGASMGILRLQSAEEFPFLPGGILPDPMSPELDQVHASTLLFPSVPVPPGVETPPKPPPRQDSIPKCVSRKSKSASSLLQRHLVIKSLSASTAI